MIFILFESECTYWFAVCWICVVYRYLPLLQTYLKLFNFLLFHIISNNFGFRRRENSKNSCQKFYWNNINQTVKRNPNAVILTTEDNSIFYRIGLNALMQGLLSPPLVDIPVPQKSLNSDSKSLPPYDALRNNKKGFFRKG